MRPMMSKSIPNLCGAISVLIVTAFWLCMGHAPPLSNVYFRLIGLPVLIGLALLLAIFASVRGSRWWMLAIVLPTLTLLGLLSVAG